MKEIIKMAEQLKPRYEVSEDLKWDLTGIFATEEDFKAALEIFPHEVDAFVEQYKGKLKDAEIAVDKAIATLENKPTGSSSKKKAETLNDIAIYLPDAYATRDDSGVFKNFFTTSEEEIVPTAIVMDEDALGFYIQNPDAEDVALIEWSNTKLGTSLTASE